MSSHVSQTASIMQALLDGDRLTPLDALGRFGCLRLAARIRDIKELGVPVNVEITKFNGKRFATYWVTEVGRE